MPSGNKPSREPILTKIYVAIWCHWSTAHWVTLTMEYSMQTANQTNTKPADTLAHCIAWSSAAMLLTVWIGLDLFNDDTCPSGHISRPTHVNVSQSCLYALTGFPQTNLEKFQWFFNDISRQKSKISMIILNVTKRNTQDHMLHMVSSYNLWALLGVFKKIC